MVPSSTKDESAQLDLGWLRIPMTHEL